MKRYVTLVLCFALVLPAMAGVVQNSPSKEAPIDTTKLSVEFKTDWDGIVGRKCGEPTTARIRFLLNGRPQAVKGVKVRIDDWVRTLSTTMVDVPTNGCERRISCGRFRTSPGCWRKDRQCQLTS